MQELRDNSARCNVASGSSEISNDGTVATIKKNSTEVIVVTVNNFKGKQRCDVRVWSTWVDGQTQSPTRKGINLSLEQVPDLISALKLACDQERIEPPPAKPMAKEARRE